MSDEDANVELSIEDISNPNTVLLSCGMAGAVTFPQDIDFTVPPPNSPNAGRLVLATSKTGSIDVSIFPNPHLVCLKIVKGRTNPQLLIRVPIGVHIFKVKAANGFFFYYETGDGYNIVPIFIPMGSDADPGQKVQEVVLAVSPVPPRDPNDATVKPFFKEITLRQLNTRRAQNDLPPISKKK